MSRAALLRMAALIGAIMFGGVLVVSFMPGPVVAQVGAYLAWAAVVVAVRLALWGTRD